MLLQIFLEKLEITLVDSLYIKKFLILVTTAHLDL